MERRLVGRIFGRLSRSLGLVSGAVFLTILVGCAGAPAAAPTRTLPAYAGRSKELFDDAIEPRAVGLDPNVNANSKSDPLLRERVQIGDATLRVRVDTVTVKHEDTETIYQLGFRVIDKMAGAHPPDESFTVRVGRQSPSVGILKSYEGQLVGKKFVAFIRLFSRADGDPDVHFHLAPDSKEVAAAVHDANVLSDLQ